MALTKWRVRTVDSHGNPLVIGYYKIHSNAVERCIKKALDTSFTGIVTVEERQYKGGVWDIIRTIHADKTWRDKVAEVRDKLNQLFGG